MQPQKPINKETLELLKRIFSLSEFHDFVLVGGTNLALQIQHRLSVDLDLFTDKDLDLSQILSILVDCFRAEKIENVNEARNIVSLFLNNIKIDLVKYPYSFLEAPFIYSDEIRLASLKDTAAMKLAAIAGRGAKKDFIDLFFLLNHYQLSEMIRFFQQKYQSKNTFHLIKSLVYFADAEEDKTEILLIKQIQWSEVKIKIQKEVKNLKI